MRAIVIKKPGGPQVLELLRDLPDVIPQRNEVRIRVRATAVNRADVLQREGKYPPPPDCSPNIPGLEYAGEVEAIGEGNIDLAIGDRVFGLVGGGSYSEFIVVHWRTVSPMPKGFSFEDAAALPEACVTAYDAMVTQCGLSPGETVLINAAASGVGTAAIQIARALGATTIGTTRSVKKLTLLTDLGLDHGIDSSGGQYANKVLALTHKHGADVILELVGGGYLNEDVRCASVKGRIILVGMLGGAHIDFDLGRVLTRRLVIRGTTLRARPLEEKILVAQTLTRNIVPLIEKGLVKPVIDKVYPLEKVSDAHSHMESNSSFGKIVLTV
jgi:putative PIG3 family NAD(P)H quinone oxidoreductase